MAAFTIVSLVEQVSPWGLNFSLRVAPVYPHFERPVIPVIAIN